MGRSKTTPRKKTERQEVDGVGPRDRLTVFPIGYRSGHSPTTTRTFEKNWKNEHRTELFNAWKDERLETKGTDRFLLLLKTMKELKIRFM